jgi:hypothetical protein
MDDTSWQEQQQSEVRPAGHKARFCGLYVRCVCCFVLLAGLCAASFIGTAAFTCYGEGSKAANDTGGSCW